MSELWDKVLALAIVFILIVIFIRWFRKSERELLEKQPEVPVHKPSRWDAVGIAVFFGPIAVLATRMAYWNIKQLGWTQGVIVGCIIAAVVDILVVGLVIVSTQKAPEKTI